MIDVPPELKEEMRAYTQSINTYLSQERKLIEAQLDVITNLANIDDELEGGKWEVIAGGPLGSEAETLAYKNLADLTRIRNLGRSLAIRNPFAINAIENGKSYVIGTGHTYKIKPRENVNVPESVLSTARRVLDDFLKRNRWHLRQEETWERRERDGEVFRRIFNDNGLLNIRFVEPEFIIAPPQDRISLRAPFGIEYLEIDEGIFDYETPTIYYVGRSTHDMAPGSITNAVTTPEPIDASEIQHIKANVDLNAPRGIPTFYPVEPNLRRASKILRNMSTVVEIQAAIAWVRKHMRNTQAAVQQYITDMADVKVTSTLTQSERHYKQYPPGTILDIPDTVDYQFPGISVDVSRIVVALQAELRTIASRLQYPEFMLSSDASNANYSSTMVAEGPAVKKFERMQQRIIEYDLEIIHSQLIISPDLPDNILELVEVEAEGPNVKTRQFQEEVTGYTALVESKIVSRQTASAHFGYEYEKEQELIDKDTQRTQERLEKYGPPEPLNQPPPNSNQPSPPEKPATPQPT